MANPPVQPRIQQAKTRQENNNSLIKIRQLRNPQKASSKTSPHRSSEEQRFISELN
jgi:hypothetical protein